MAERARQTRVEAAAEDSASALSGPDADTGSAGAACAAPPPSPIAAPAAVIVSPARSSARRRGWELSDVPWDSCLRVGVE